VKESERNRESVRKEKRKEVQRERLLTVLLLVKMTLMTGLAVKVEREYNKRTT